MDYLQRTRPVSVAATISHDRVAQARYPELFDVAACLARPGVERVARVAIADILPMSPATPGVPSDQREGVFIHSFICNRCGLPIDPAGHPCPAANGSRPIF